MKLNSKFIIKTGIILAIIVFLSYRPTSSVKSAINQATTHEPENFTELYFENSNSLPKIIKEGSDYNFTFTVRNRESKNFNYSYIVYVQNNNNKATIDEGSFILKDQERKSIQINFGPLANKKDEIIVELVEKNQQIDFWMEPSI